ncbi:hypothetical protein GQ651_08530 [Alphaproteobacteria bacterium GH1-50]|uniref:Uncharacterized protein n=1 Tax=Kangsaoukella pontilimi TaxID=2691042 RepID=A0A7C9IP67_9RHOB|nr:hypothetical protein [Kangsaoukella pontilimi]MXQ07890.1 hypothetical protein [Kangsaoukella pontilimi]
MPNRATAIMQPPKERQAGNASVMSFEDMREELFEELDRQGGVITRACRELGVSFHAVHRERIRDARFAAELAARIDDARRNRAMEMVDLADRHVRSHLERNLEPLIDDDGNLVLDDDFEPVMVSRLPLKGVIDARREYRQQLDGGEGTSIAIQNVNEAVVAQVPPTAPRLVRPELSADSYGMEDAEIIEELYDAEE